MAALLATVVNNGIYQEKRILSPESVAIILNPTLTAVPRHGVFWETAVSELAQMFPNPIIGHSGSDPGASAFMYFDPETQLAAIVLLNSDTHTAEEAGLNILLQILGSEGTGRLFPLQ